MASSFAAEQLIKVYSEGKGGADDSSEYIMMRDEVERRLINADVITKLKLGIASNETSVYEHCLKEQIPSILITSKSFVSKNERVPCVSLSEKFKEATFVSRPEKKGCYCVTELYEQETLSILPLKDILNHTEPKFYRKFPFTGVGEQIVYEEEDGKTELLSLELRVLLLVVGHLISDMNEGGGRDAVFDLKWMIDTSGSPFEYWRLENVNRCLSIPSTIPLVMHVRFPLKLLNQIKETGLNAPNRKVLEKVFTDTVFIVNKTVKDQINGWVTALANRQEEEEKRKKSIQPLNRQMSSKKRRISELQAKEREKEQPEVDTTSTSAVTEDSKQYETFGDELLSQLNKEESEESPPQKKKKKQKKIQTDEEEFDQLWTDVLDSVNSTFKKLESKFFLNRRHSDQ